jgi:hypothetical protein
MADITNQDQEGAYRDKVAQLRAENARLRAELEKYSETHRPARLESAPPTTDQRVPRRCLRRPGRRDSR